MKPKTEKIRLLILLANLAGGGAERTAVRVLRGLDRRVFEPKVGVLWGTGAFVDQVSPDDLMVADLPELEKSSYASLVFRVPVAHSKMLKTFRPHVVMSLTASMNVACCVATALYGREKVGWVLREGNNTWKMIQDDLPNPWLAKLRKAITGFTYRKADAVLAISEGLADGLVREFSVSRDRVQVIHNPVVLDVVERLPQERPLIVAAGRLEYQKGFDILLEAFAQLPDKQAELLILGEGSQRLSLEEQVVRLGLQGRVSLPGFSEDINSELGRAHMFVLSSRWEGFGCVVVEAMAQSLPIIVTDCDYGPSEIVTHETDGLVVSSGSSKELSQAMHRLLSAPHLAAQLGHNAGMRAQDFAVEQIVEKYQSLWTRVAKLSSC